MINIRRRDTFNFYESFSDLIFCTLVLFLVLVLFLSLNVNRRIENIQAVEKGLESQKKGIVSLAQELENKQADVIILKDQLAAEIERINKLDSLESRIAKLKKELEIEKAQIAIRKKELTKQTDQSQELENQETHLANLQKQLQSKETHIAKLKEGFGTEVERIKELEKLKESVQFEDTATGKIYTFSGSKGHGIMVPCYRRHQVLLVVDKRSGKMTFEGQPTTWKQLPNLLSKVPYRHRTWLDIAFTRSVSKIQFMQFWRNPGPIAKRMKSLKSQFGFELNGHIENHPLGTKGAQVRPPELVPYKPYGN